MTLPAFKAAGTGHETSVPWPAGHASGDFALCCIEHQDATITTPSGWTFLVMVATSAQSTRLSIFYRFATSAAESNFAITGATDHNYGAIVTYTGVNTLNPFHQIATADNVNSTTNWAPGLTTLLPDCMIVNIFGRSPDVAGAQSSGETNADLGSLTERFDDGTATGTGGGVVIIDGTKAAKGDVTFTQITLATSSASNCVTLALQAADQTFGIRGLITNLGQHRMAIPCKQSTAQSFRVFMADSADGKSGKTGLTLAVTLQKEGDSSFSSISPTVTEIGTGHYNLALTTTHMNTLGLCSIRATATGADPADCPNCIDVIAYDKQSATRGTAGTALPAVAAEAAGGLFTRGTGAGQINQDANGRIDTRIAAENISLISKIDTIDDFIDTEVAAIKAKTDSLTFTVAGKVDANVTHVSGDSAAADNLEATFDGTGYTDNFAPATQQVMQQVFDGAVAISGFVDTEVAAIKAKTDQLTFTVANQVDANALTGGGGGGGGGGMSSGYGEQRIEQDSTASLHFTLLDADGVRVTGATELITATISINGGTPIAVAGTFEEIDDTAQPGEYRYILDDTETASIGTLLLFLTPNADEFVPVSVQARVVGPSTVDNAAIATAVDELLTSEHGDGNWSFDEAGEGSNTYGDLFRLLVGVLAGKVENFGTNTLVFKSLDGSKTRLTVTLTPVGRTASVPGNLTP